MTSQPHNESSFFQRLKKRTSGSIFWERVEPKTEGGFPDTHFVVQGDYLHQLMLCEGTMELKFSKTKLPNWKSLLLPSQKAGLIDYYMSSGRCRFFCAYTPITGLIHLVNSGAMFHVLTGKHSDDFAALSFPLEHVEFCSTVVKFLEEN